MKVGAGLVTNALDVKCPWQEKALLRVSWGAAGDRADLAMMDLSGWGLETKDCEDSPGGVEDQRQAWKTAAKRRALKWWK